MGAPGRADAAGSTLRLAQSHYMAGRVTEAEAAFRAILAVDPRNADAWQGLALLARDRGDATAASEHYARAVELAPDAFEFREQYAQLLQSSGALAAAAAQWRTAAALGSAASCEESLGIVEQALGNTEAAARAYRRALEREPTAARRIKLATLVSPIIASPETMLAERAAMEAELDALLVDPVPPLDDPLAAGLWTNFYLAFHGLNDEPLQSKTAAVHRRLCPSLLHEAPHVARARRPGRLRIGLISRYFHNHSIGRTSVGLFERLPPDELEVHALFVAPLVDDAYSRTIRRCAEHALLVPQDLGLARERIGALELDVLFYQDVGMDPFTGLLAYSRLAPVQCVSFGHPDTTGLATMDWFVSNDRYETPGSATHYSEALFQLRGLGTLAYYHRPDATAPRKPREHFGFGAGTNLYACPQNLFKFHPDLDPLLADILRRDPRGRLVVVEARLESWNDRLRARWRRTMPDVADRVVFVPRMSTRDYVDLIAASDVMLDTLHFNGMNTSLEAFSAGTPVVTLPGEFQRGRHTQAMYRQMGLDDLVAGDAAGYATLAVRLGTEPDFRADARRRILERNEALFEDPRVVGEFERFFREACGVS